jgi:hypothetical protein
MVVSASGSLFGFVVVAEIWNGFLPMLVFVTGLGAERPIGQASPREGSPSRGLHNSCAEAAVSLSGLPRPAARSFRAHGGCKVGKIPRFLSSELITF